MNNKKLIVLIIGALVVLIGGATILYNKLGDEYASEQLAVIDKQDDETQKNEDSEGKPTTETVNEAEASDMVEAESEVPDEEKASDTVETDSEVPDEEKEAESTGESEKDKTPAVDFTMYDINGNAVKLSDYYGKPIIMNFWASWCGPCKSEMPDFDKAYQTYGKDIHFLMVNLTDGYQETVESASEFISQSGYQFPVYFDSDTEGAYTYGIYSIPTTFFIDKDGNMAAYAQGAINMETLQSGIDMIYSE